MTNEERQAAEELCERMTKALRNRGLSLNDGFVGTLQERCTRGLVQLLRRLLAETGDD